MMTHLAWQAPVDSIGYYYHTGRAQLRDVTIKVQSSKNMRVDEPIDSGRG